MIIYYCFGRVIYIKMCIANAEISFYFTPGIHFLSVGKLLETTGIPAKPAGIPVRTVSTGEFEFKLAFVRFRPVTGLTGPVSRNRTPAVRGDRSENLTLA